MSQPHRRLVQPIGMRRVDAIRWPAVPLPRESTGLLSAKVNACQTGFDAWHPYGSRCAHRSSFQEVFRKDNDHPFPCVGAASSTACAKSVSAGANSDVPLPKSHFSCSNACYKSQDRQFSVAITCPRHFSAFLHPTDQSRKGQTANAQVPSFQRQSIQQIMTILSPVYCINSVILIAGEGCRTPRHDRAEGGISTHHYFDYPSKAVTVNIHSSTSLSTQTAHFGPSDRDFGNRPSLIHW